MKKNLTITLAAAAMITATAFTVQAQSPVPTLKPFLHPIFSDHAVIQRDLTVPVWGWAQPGSEITVQFSGQTVKATAGNDGKWMAHLGAMGYSANPQTMKVSGIYNNTAMTVEAKDLLIGDVWFCSGQSNMEMGIKNCNAQADIDSANFPNLRLLMVPKSVQYAPQEFTTLTWGHCTPENLSNMGVWGGFSAAAFYFGRELNTTLNVPIGVIHSSWGGTLAEAWCSNEAIATLPDFKDRLAGAKDAITKNPGNPHVVTALYNGMVCPVLPFPIMGVIWYQGCSNANRAYQYRELLGTLVKDWRKQFNVGEFPFIIVQLAAFTATHPEPRENDWAEIRESQAFVAKNVPNCGLAVTIDIGDAGDIHPKNKADVGRRLAYWALANTYGKREMPYSGPEYKSMEVIDGSIRIKFDHTCGGLKAAGNDGKLVGFAIAGEDKKFVWANAVIQDDSILVYSDQVANPVAVRYAWDINPVCNLFNGAGLPAIPFRTDDWPMITRNNK